MPDYDADDYRRVPRTLRPLPDAVPANVRLRRALKTLLRSFAMRCERVETADDRPGDDGANGGAANNGD